MSRLTKKIEDLEFYKVSSAFINEIPNQFLDKDYVGEAINKLGKLEDLEEKLGCPLEVYVKATRSGIWYSIAGVMKHCYVDVIDASKIIFAMKGTNIWFELKKYQKTWWLKKDKSE